MVRCSLSPFLRRILGILLLPVIAQGATNFGPADDFQYRQYAPADPAAPAFNYRLWIPKLYLTNGTEKHPVVIALHGMSEKEGDAIRGDALSRNTKQMVDNGQFAFTYASNQSNFPCFLIVPNSGWSGSERFSTNYPEMVRQLANEFRLDLDRVIITGLSMGGGAAFYHAIDQSDFYAAAVPMSAPTPANLDDAVRNLTNVPLWYFHAANDATIAVTSGESILAKIRTEGIPVIYTRYNTGAHVGTWPTAYKTKALYSWLKAARRGKRNPPPVQSDFDGLAPREVLVEASRNATFTGRTAIWSNENPLLGAVQRTPSLSDNFNPLYAVTMTTATGPWSFTSSTMNTRDTNFMTVVALGTTWSSALGGTNYYSIGTFVTTTQPDVMGPAISGLTSVTSTNRVFTNRISVSEDTGYLSTTGLNGPYGAFSKGNTNVILNATTTLAVFGRDRWGNNGPTNVRTVTFDMSPPVLSGLLSSRTTNQSFVLSVSVDEGAGWISTNGVSGPWASFGTGGTNIPIHRSNTVWAFARDQAGNVSATNVRTYVVQDVAAPPIASISPTSLLTNATFTVTLSAQGNAGFWSTNGIDFRSFSPSGTNVEISSTVSIWAYAASNGESGPTNRADYLVDGAIPVLSGLPDSFTTNRSFTISLNVDENDGFVSTNGASGPFTRFPTGTTNLTIGTTTVIGTYARDAAGNNGPTNVRTYVLDRTAPTVSGFPNDLSTNAPFSFVATVDETAGYVSTNGPAGPYVTFSSNGFPVTIEGTTTVWFYGRDPFGNGSATNVRTYQVLAPLPVVTVSPASLATNRPFVVRLSTDRDVGFWSPDGTNFRSFPASGTNLFLDASVTLWTFGATNGPTNRNAYTVDSIAPKISGLPPSLTTNRTWTVFLTVDEDHGYVSTNGETGPWSLVDRSGTNLTIAATTTVWWFTRDFLGNNSATNAATYVVDRRVPVVSISHDGAPNNSWFLLSLGVDRGTGFFSTNGSAFAPFPPTGTNLLIRETTELLVFGRDDLGNVSLTNRENYVHSTDPQYFEAEFSEFRNPLFLSLSNDLASGSLAIGTTNGMQKGIPATNVVEVQYRFQVAASGRYFFWGRTFATSGNDNSFFVAMDQGATNVWDVNVATNWIWGPFQHTNAAHTRMTFDLSAGWHTLSVQFREDGAWLDAFCLGTVSNFNPATNAVVPPPVVLTASASPSNGDVVLTFHLAGSTTGAAAGSPLRTSPLSQAVEPIGAEVEMTFEVRETGSESWSVLPDDRIKGARKLSTYGTSSVKWTGIQEPWKRFDVRISAFSEGILLASTTLADVRLLPDAGETESLARVTLFNNPSRGTAPVVLMNLPGDARVNAFTTSGRWISEIKGGTLRTWNPADRSERPLPPGIYVLRVETPRDVRFLNVVVAP